MSKPHFLWVDNYAKTLARSVPTLDMGAYNACYWSGAVVFPSNDPAVTDAIRRDDLGCTAPRGTSVWLVDTPSPGLNFLTLQWVCVAT
jgi:hypothetical protein